MTGVTASPNFPTQGALQAVYRGGPYDVFVSKLNAAGDSLTYSTYLGGTGTDSGLGVAVDGAGNAYVTGFTGSTDFPTQRALQATSRGSVDVFVSKLNVSGSALSYSTYLGGAGTDSGRGISVDGAGNAYVTGQTTSTNFPTQGALQAANGGRDDAFVSKLNGDGSALSYSSYLGGSGTEVGLGLGVDGAGNAYVTGYTTSTNFPTQDAIQTASGGSQDAFISKVNPAGSALTYSTYLGGTDNERGQGIALDGAGNAYVTGSTGSTDFPTQRALQTASGGSQDAFVSKLNPAGSAFTYSTYRGGAGFDDGRGIAVDGAGNAYLTGYTESMSFSTQGAFQPANGGDGDAFVVRLGDAPLSLTPATASTFPRGTVALTSAGGTAPFTWSVSTNNSGGSVTAAGVFAAGATGGVADTVTVTDALGATALSTITVTAGVSITPASASVAPGGSQSFSAAGGSNSGFTWALTTNASGGSITAAGVYTAGPTPSVTDVITVTDAVLNTRTASIMVGAGVAINPAAPAVTPRGAVAFTASGGSNAGFTWSLTTNASGGAIVAATGAYTAGASPNVTDVVRVTDSLGNTATVNVSVGAGITVNPALSTRAPKATLAFSATGGSGAGYAWSVSTNNSGASIVAATGAYTAGSAGNVTDTVTVQDSLGNVATATVNVGPGVTIAGASSAPPRGTIGFAVSGGSGAGYTWSLPTNLSGATVSAAGSYVAGTTGSVSDVVRVTDALGNAAMVTVSVGPGVTLTPAASTLAPRAALAFDASGGSGAGFAWTFATNASGGTLVGATGAYVAGSTGSVTDTIRVTDALGNTQTATVMVSARVSISPAAPSAPPLGTVNLAAAGGSGAGFTWSLSASPSGGSIAPTSGVYTAGPTPSVTDVARVTDSLGNTATVNVSVGAGLAVTPAAESVAPRGSATFTAIGGSGTGYAWSLATTPSGGTITAAGVYTAGATGSVTDVVRVMDSLGNVKTANVTVGPRVTLTPASGATPPSGAVTFAVAGGSGLGYVYALPTNASGGTIDATTGAYRAGVVGSVRDVVRVTDSLGNTAEANVAVGAGITATPASATLAPRAAQLFTATGGSGLGFAWTLATNASGGSLSSTGAYVAGAIPNTTDVARVTDSLGNVKTAAITVGAGVSIAPASPSAPPSGAIAFAATGGSGSTYTWALTTNASGGAIVAATGAYTAGPTGMVADVVRATDALGNTASVSVSVGGGLALTPASPTLAPRAGASFTAIGGSGAGFVWSLLTNASGGSIVAATGAYVAGPTGSVTDVVRVTDSLGNTGSTRVTVGAGLGVAPASVTVAPRGAQSFAVSGGSGVGYAWSLSTNASAGTIDAATGAYVAGATPSGVDVVTVTDSPMFSRASAAAVGFVWWRW